MAVAKPITASCPQEGLNRRNLLMALPFAGAALALPKLAEAETSRTRVFHAYVEWKLAFNDCNSPRTDRTEEEEQAILNRMFRLADEILDIPSECPMDLIYKLMAYTLEGDTDPLDGEHGHKIYVEARSLIAEQTTPRIRKGA